MHIIITTQQRQEFKDHIMWCYSFIHERSCSNRTIFSESFNTTGHASKSPYIHKVRAVGATFIKELSLKSVLEKWIESEIVLLSYIKKMGSLTPLGQVKLII